MTVYRCINCGETAQPIPPVKREPLKIGDRVAFYDTNGRHTATIVSAITDYLGRILVTPDDGPQKLVHLKQVSKLRKRKRRSVWIPKEAFLRAKQTGANQIITGTDGPWIVRLEPPEPGMTGWVEFREAVRPVRK